MNDLQTRLLWSGALAAAAALLWLLWPRLAATPDERQALREGRVVITYWDRHAGHEHAARVALINEFNRSQDAVFVRPVAIGYNATMEKTLTSTAGGTPPDLLSLDGAMLAQLSAQGLFLPLEDFMAATPSLRQETFFPHIWEMVAFDGHVWSIPTTTDSYCLVWNKQAFREAGLDPDRPPQDLEELQDFAARLTIRSESGDIEQMGFLPWIPWDLSHMWGILFGGTWYDGKTGLVSCGRDPKIIASLAWQRSFTTNPDAESQLPYAMDPSRVAAFSRGIGEYASANNPFYSGKVAMITEGEWQVTFIPKYAPGLDWGVAPLPQPKGAAPAGYGPTCISDVIPVTARHPEEAKAFLRWFYSPRPEGGFSPASDYCFAIHNVPPRHEEALQERFIGHPKFRVFVEQLLHKAITPYPTTPVTQFLNDQIERQRERVVFRKISPEDAAMEIEEMVNRELSRTRALAARRAS